MKTKRYIKKPVIIDAYRAEKEEFFETTEGTRKADVGDYVIIGFNGEKIPCKPDLFNKLYEEI